MHTGPCLYQVLYRLIKESYCVSGQPLQLRLVSLMTAQSLRMGTPAVEQAVWLLAIHACVCVWTIRDPADIVKSEDKKCKVGRSDS